MEVKVESQHASDKIEEYFFEIAADGRPVWSFVNRYDAGRVARLSEAKRYPAEYAAFAAAACPAS